MKTTLLYTFFFVFRWLRLLFMCVCIFFLFSPHLYFKHLKQKKKKRKKNFEKKKQQQKNTYTSIWVPGSFLMCNKVKVSVCNWAIQLCYVRNNSNFGKFFYLFIYIFFFLIFVHSLKWLHTVGTFLVFLYFENGFCLGGDGSTQFFRFHRVENKLPWEIPTV